MKVSVIVPVYNVEKYLEKCLDSLVNQDFSDYEIIIVNDGSLDKSDKIIGKYVDRYSNIKAFNKENGGLSSARNYGLQYASGEYISFVDSDDYVERNFLKVMYKKALEDKSDIVVCEFNYVYDNGDIVRSYSNLDYTTDPSRKYLLTPPMAPIRLIKKDLLEKIRFQEGIFYEDLQLCPKLVLYTKKISFVNDALYNYLMRDGSIMKQKVFNEKLLDIFSVLESNKKILEKKYHDEIEYMYIIHLLRTAGLRFLDYDNYYEMIDKIVNVINKDFPNWKDNIYYKKSNKKIKMICYLVYNKNYLTLKLIKKISGK